MLLYLGHSFFVLWHSHTIFDTWMYHHGTICCIHSWPLYDLDLWPQYQNLYFHHEFKSGKIALLFDIGIPRSGIWVYYHETTCCVHSWPLNDLDIWPICGWRGVSLVSLAHSFFYLVLYALGFCVNHAVIYMYFGFNYRWSKHPATIFDNHDLPWLFHLWSFLVSIFSNWG